MLFLTEDSDGVGDESEDGGEEEGEEELANAEEVQTEALVGEEQDQGDKEFVDNEHESQFCLENNFMGEGGQEHTAEQEDSKGEKGGNNFSSK